MQTHRKKPLGAEGQPKQDETHDVWTSLGSAAAQGTRNSTNHGTHSYGSRHRVVDVRPAAAGSGLPRRTVMLVYIGSGMVARGWRYSLSPTGVLFLKVRVTYIMPNIRVLLCCLPDISDFMPKLLVTCRAFAKYREKQNTAAYDKLPQKQGTLRIHPRYTSIWYVQNRFHSSIYIYFAGMCFLVNS